MRSQGQLVCLWRTRGRLGTLQQDRNGAAAQARRQEGWSSLPTPRSSGDAHSIFAQSTLPYGNLGWGLLLAAAASSSSSSSTGSAGASITGSAGASITGSAEASITGSMALILSSSSLSTL